MNPNPSDDLETLFACLVRAVRDQRPEQLALGFDVSELLTLVPYRGVRAQIGAATHDDYAHAVMRLLAGERGLLVSDDLMQHTLTAELESKNPNLQAYRSFLNTRVTLSQEQVRAVLGSFSPEPLREHPVPHPPAPASAGVPARAERPDCTSCGQPLPAGRDIRFCPHCGQNVAELRCGACNTAFEPGWKFCVTCGRATTR